MSIPGLPSEACDQVLAEIQKQTPVQRVVLYGSRALGRYHSGSDVDLCLTTPTMTLEHRSAAGSPDQARGVKSLLKNPVRDRVASVKS